MDLFFRAAHAAEEGGAAPGAAEQAQAPMAGMAGMLLPIVLFIAIFYFLIMRPQKKQRQQHDNMLKSITRGDTVVTAGGFFGRVSDELEDSFVIEIAEGVKVRILKSSISSRREDPSAGSRSADRPRRRRRRKRPEGAPAEISEGESTPAESDGVTEAENEMLVSSEEKSDA